MEGETTDIELPIDAKGREIPSDTEVPYSEDGKTFDVHRYTYSVRQTVPQRKWGVVTMNCIAHNVSDLHPTPPDSREKPSDDLGEDTDICGHFEECPEIMFGKSCSKCKKTILGNIASRIRKLRGEGDG